MNLSTDAEYAIVWSCEGLHVDTHHTLWNLMAAAIWKAKVEAEIAGEDGDNFFARLRSLVDELERDHKEFE